MYVWSNGLIEDHGPPIIADWGIKPASGIVQGARVWYYQVAHIVYVRVCIEWNDNGRGSWGVSVVV
jgi:hypothetical protein